MRFGREEGRGDRALVDAVADGHRSRRGQVWCKLVRYSRGNFCTCRRMYSVRAICTQLQISYLILRSLNGIVGC